MFSHNVNNISNVAQQQVQQNRVKVTIANWQNGSMQDLLNFISRHTRVSLMQATVQGQLVVGYVNNNQQAQEVKKWNGAKFAGNNLKIDIDSTGANGTGANNGGTSSTVQFLKNILFKRYDRQNKMLNLGDLVNDPELVNNNMFSAMARQSKVIPAILKVASTEEELKYIESLNLANNNLKDLVPIANLPLTFKKLKNLCLANNSFTRFQTFTQWKNKFTQIREILMVNNPICNDRMYRSEMLNIFPKLAVLDNNMIRDEVKLKSVFSIMPILNPQQPNAAPSKFQPFFFESQDISNVSTNFISNFLNFWDLDRTQLLNLYTPQSQFSVSMDSSIPSSTVKESDQTPSFGYYISSSRNFTKISTPKLLQERLATGQEQINNLFNSIPKTKHFLMENPNDYSVEAVTYQNVNGFLVTLHGYFEEVEKPLNDSNSNNGNKKTSMRNKRYNNNNTTSNKRLSKKSFDRTWVIINNTATNSIVIASDLLTVRAYCQPSWHVEQPPTPMQAPTPNISGTVTPTGSVGVTPVPGMMPVVGTPVGTPVVSPNLQLPPEIQAKLNPIQLELLNKLQLQTKLNSEYTYMLAEQSGWNFDTAAAAFQSSVANLPPNAFIQG
ncbi:mRNA export factor Mex67p [Monosporozyma servazzii]